MKPDDFLSLGLRITNKVPNERAYSTELDHYKTFFGVSPSNTAIIWAKIRQYDLAPRAKPSHLLWAFMWLFVYAGDKVLAAFLAVDVDTFTMWSYEMTKAIAKLKLHYVRQDLSPCQRTPCSF